MLGLIKCCFQSSLKSNKSELSVKVGHVKRVCVCGGGGGGGYDEWSGPLGKMD